MKHTAHELMRQPQHSAAILAEEAESKAAEEADCKSAHEDTTSSLSGEIKENIMPVRVGLSSDTEVTKLRNQLELLANQVCILLYIVLLYIVHLHIIVHCIRVLLLNFLPLSHEYST